MKITNKLVRKVSLCFNAFFILVIIILSFYISNLNKDINTYKQDYSRSLGYMFIQASLNTPLNGLKLPLVGTLSSKTSVICSPSKNDEVNRLLNKYFKTCDEVKTMWSIAQAESKGLAYSINKNNRNGSWDCGWSQINTIHRKKGESKDDFCVRMHNLEENIKAASVVYKQAGYKFTPWVTYNYNLHLAYLN